jgi:hypothetical protein
MLVGAGQMRKILHAANLPQSSRSCRSVSSPGGEKHHSPARNRGRPPAAIGAVVFQGSWGAPACIGNMLRNGKPCAQYLLNIRVR